MNILIACERSGVVREAFRSRGHNAWSCDLVPADDGSPHHIQGDALETIASGAPDGRGRWQLVIAHPPCTRLANSGALRLYKGGKFDNGRDIGKWDEMDRAALFFRRFFVECRGIKLCVENPIHHGHAYEMHACGKPTQIVQPYYFGEDASKATGLWLLGLPQLKSTGYFKPRMICRCGWEYAHGKDECPNCGETVALARPRWGNQTDSGQNRLPPSERRAEIRSRTYPGIARAMAEQWGEITP